jgi:cytosine/adenosine deaminase-related metal-dependent hydrolase
MSNTTLIKNADWVVGWDSGTGKHKYIKNGDVTFSGNQIDFVGSDYSGEADETIDGTDLMVLPGTTTLHAHAALEIPGKGFWEDLASKHLWMSQLFEYTWLIQPDEETQRLALQAGICEALKSGCTTFTELDCPWPPFPGWLDIFAKSGIRAYACPMVQSGEWYTNDGKEVLWRWFDEKIVDSNFRQSLELIDEAEGHSSGRLNGMIGPAQVDTCTAELIKACVAAAEERGVPLQVHASQSVVEFREMVKRHNMTPIAWLDSLGALGPNTIIGHGINPDRHPWVNFHTQYTPDNDVARLARTGTTVAHCARAFAQWGDMMRSLGAYRAEGVNMALGTDAYPIDLIEEMRIALLMSKVSSGHVDLLKTEDIFEIATLGAAKGLNRDDIGRLSVGAKADVVLVNLKHPNLRPLRDPLKCLIHAGTAEAVRDVYVDGNLVVSDRKVLTMDQDAILDELQDGQARIMENMPSVDYANRSADEISPFCLPVEGA